MAIQLHGKNFQSWEEFTLDIDRLTVAVGDSNLGKSALIRAFKGLVRNELNSGQVRVGSSLMEVSAVIDGHNVSASRKKGPKGSVSYTVDGEDFAKLGGATPKAILDLNLGDIQIGDVSLDPIFATQFGGQFLIEEKPAALTAILGAFSATDKLENGKRITNQDIAEQNTLAKNLAADIQRSEALLAALAALESRGDRLTGIMDDLGTAIASQESAVEVFGTAITHTASLASIEAMLYLLEVPDTSPVERSLSLLNGYSAAESALARSIRTQAALSRLSVPDTAPIEHAVRLVLAYGSVSEAQARFDRTIAVLNRLEVPDTSQAKNLEHRVVALGGLERATVRQAAATAALSAIEAVAVLWTGIVALHKRGKAMEQATRAMEVKFCSSVQMQIGALDAITSRTDALRNRAEDLERSIRAQDALIHAREARNLLADKIMVTDEQIAAAEKIVAQMQEQQNRRGLEEKLEAARKEQSKTVVCGKCGEKIRAA